MTSADITVTLARRGCVPDTSLTGEDRSALRELTGARSRDYREGRALLRWSLRRAFGAGCARAPIQPDSRGKPVLRADRPIGISISHSGTALAVAVAAGREVGVDVQTLVTPTEGLIRRCCRPQDRAEVAALPEFLRAGAFTSIWTVQEACLKASGEGVRFRPGRVPVIPFQRYGVWRGYLWRALPPFAGNPVAVAASRLPVPPSTVHVVLVPSPPERTVL